MLTALLLLAAPPDAAQAALTKAGFKVTVEPATSAGLGWAPKVDGRKLTVVDTSRTTTATPYAELRKEPAKPANSRLTLYFLPKAKMTAHVDMMSRMQPAEVLGAVGNEVVFVMQPPQGGDVDDGKLLESIRTALFPNGKNITVKQTQNGGSAELELQP